MKEIVIGICRDITGLAANLDSEWKDEKQTNRFSRKLIYPQKITGEQEEKSKRISEQEFKILFIKKLETKSNIFIPSKHRRLEIIALALKTVINGLAILT